MIDNKVKNVYNLYKYIKTMKKTGVFVVDKEIKGARLKDLNN